MSSNYLLIDSGYIRMANNSLDNIEELLWHVFLEEVESLEEVLHKEMKVFLCDLFILASEKFFNGLLMLFLSFLLEDLSEKVVRPEEVRVRLNNSSGVHLYFFSFKPY